MHLIFLLFLVIFALPCLALEAGEDQQRSETDPCSRGLNSEWTPSEVWAWGEICAGRIADMRNAPGGAPEAGCNAWVHTGPVRAWPQARILSSKFIEAVATTSTGKEVSAQRVVAILCAEIKGRVDFQYKVLPNTLWLLNSRIHHGIDLNDSRVEGDLLFIGSDFGGKAVNAGDLFVRSDWRMDNSRFPAVYAHGGEISSTITANGAQLTGGFIAEGLTVGGGFYVAKNAELGGPLDLYTANIGGTFNGSTSKFHDGINLAEAHIGGSLLLKNGGTISRRLNLNWANISGRIEISDIQEFDGGVYATGVKVKNSITFNNVSIGEKGVRFDDAAVSGNLGAFDTTIGGPFSAVRSSIGGNLAFLHKTNFHEEVNLFGAKISGAIDTNSSVFSKSLILARAEINDHVVLDGSIFFGRVSLQATSLGGSFSMRGENTIFKDGVNFHGANIGGNIEVLGALVDGPFVGEDLDLGGSLFLRDRAHFSDSIILVGAKIEGSLEVKDSEFSEVFNLRGANVERDILFDGCIISGLLNAEGASINGRFAINGDDTFLKGELNLLDATVGGSFIVAGASFGGPLLAERLEVGGSLFIRNRVTLLGDVKLGGANISGAVETNGSAFLKPFSLFGAHIGGHLSLDGAKFFGPLYSESARVQGSIFMRGDNTKFEETVDFSSAAIEGNILAINAAFGGPFAAIGSEIGGNIFIEDDTSFEEFVNLSLARVSGTFSATNSTFDGDFGLEGASVEGDVKTKGAKFRGYFFARGITVGGNMMLRSGATFNKSIDLRTANIQKSLQMHGSVFKGRVDLSSAQVAREFNLGAKGEHALWQFSDDSEDNGPTLILRNTQVGALQAVMPHPDRKSAVHSWRRKTSEGSYEDLPVDLSNFTYDQLGGFGADAGQDVTRIDADRLKAWVEQSVPQGMTGQEGYAPQPYMQLANTLRNMGAERAADAIDFARYEHRMETRQNGFYKAWDWFTKWTVGFGVYPVYALINFVILVLLGCVVSIGSRGFHGPVVLGRFLYSFGNSLPLFELGGGFEKIDHGRDCVAIFFHFQKILGFILATVLVASLTVLGS